MRIYRYLPGIAVLATMLAGCADAPSAPTIAVMPAPGMPFSVFQQDNAMCQEYARVQIGAHAGRASN